MANFKRRKSHKTVKCTMCTGHSWKGNSKDRFAPSTLRKLQTEV